MGSSRLLVDDQVNGGILDVIRGASRWVILVSPYLGLGKWAHARQAIQGACSKRVDIKIYLRDQEETESLVSDVEWLLSQGVKVMLVRDLHAKIYANESMTIVSSMNLTGHSANNSREIAIQVDDEISKELAKYVQSLDSDSEELPLPAKRAREVIGSAKRTQRVEEGRCIRCQRGLPFDVSRPLCKGCYNIWNQYADPDYAEQYCMACGREKRGITYAKPLCHPCYTRLEF